ncbi:MAG TPA: hypothetical protein GX506_03810 [Firmicutes bacterium]|nr:hypothetical protein [Bacillota bacterium]
MNKLECVLATLRHEEPEVIPNQVEFFDDKSQQKFLPPVQAQDWREALIQQYEFLDNFIVRVARSGFLMRTVEKSPDRSVIEFETGARWVIHRKPYWREYTSRPIQHPRDLDRFEMPDPDKPAARPGFTRNYEVDNMYKPNLAETSRYSGIAEDVSYFKQRGYFTTAEINGFFSGVWYFLRGFEDFLMDMVTDEGFARQLVDMIGEFNLKDAKNLLDTGIHCIDFCDDLGHNRGMFISPKMYEKYFLPWHARLAALCHSYGAYVNIHSHGNINEIMPMIVDAGIDILNPVGPSDGMNLAELKRKYGHRITFFGGISKFIGEMDSDQLERHIRDVITAGAPCGGFILREEGGVPYTMSEQNFRFYLEISRKYRREKNYQRENGKG